MKYTLVYALTLLLICACSFKSEPEVSNQYIKHTKELTVHGLDALHQGRLASAQHSLELALNSAWLSTDIVWVGMAQYHLGALYMTQGKTKQAVDLFHQAQAHASSTKDQRTLWRCMFALALYHEQSGVTFDISLPALQKEMPADVYISAGRLAQLKGQEDEAKAAFQHVLALPVSDAGRLYEHTQANMGLALLAREQGNKEAVSLYSNAVISLSHEAGFPMLAAHAYLLQGKVLGDENVLSKAFYVYQALGDSYGQTDALNRLIILAQERKDNVDLSHWMRMKQSIEK